MKKYILIATCLIATHAHAMKKPSELTPKEKDQREEAFEARMRAMRIEQAFRQETGNQEGPKVEVVEHGHGTIDFGPEGITIEDFIGALKQARAEYVEEHPQPKGEKIQAKVSTFSTPELIAQYEAEGYKAYPQEDGLVGFCLPGKEKNLTVLLKVHRAGNLNNNF